MNIFYLSKSAQQAAQMHCDKHVVKMIVESAQLLSTAVRLTHGVESIVANANGRKMKRFVINDDRDSILYHATHVNHPSAIWTRRNQSNYLWLFELYCNLLDEYTYRYGKEHKSAALLGHLATGWRKLPTDSLFSDPTPVMPDYCKIPGNSVASYQNYYRNEKKHFAKWTRRTPPSWFINTTQQQ